MIFSSEQPQTGMNEGTWFTQGRCIKKMKEYFVGKGNEKEDHRWVILLL